MNLKNLTQLIIGLFFYALGILFTVQANLGVPPWDAFHIGLSKQTDITLGTAITVTGFFIVLFNIMTRQKIGIGTLLNMWLIGVFVDIQMNSHLVPIADSIPVGIIMILIGMFLIALATWLYISAGLGSGPRDGLMVAIMKWTGQPVGIVRTSIEMTVLLIGILLGGPLGLGTPIVAILQGPICQIVFKLVKFDVKNIEHKHLRLKRSPA